jgi:hypothetical protein
MSRADKRYRQPSEDTASVRLFSFSNLVKGYQPQFAPRRPCVILRTKARAPDQHPCAQWEPLAQQLYKADLHFPGLFVVDSAAVDESVTREEEGSVVTAGPVARRVSNVISRLNLCGASLVAAGPTCLFAAKLAFLSEKRTNSRGDRMYAHLILLCPSSAEQMAQLLSHCSKHGPPRNAKVDAPLVEKVTVLLTDEKQVQIWRELLQTHQPRLFGEFKIVFPCQNLFRVLSAQLVDDGPPSQVEEADPNVFLPSPAVFRITFVLSRFTKQVEQEVESAPLDEPVDARRPAAGDVSETRQENTGEEPLEEEPAGPALLFPALVSSGRLRRTTMEGVVAAVLGDGVFSLGNAHGCVDVTVPTTAASSMAAGSRVVVVGSSARSSNGQMSIDAVSVEQLGEQLGEEAFPHVLPLHEVPRSVNFSRSMQHCGVCLVRGRKCVLVRPPRRTGAESGALRFPSQPFTSRFSSREDCAMDALCTQCDITSDGACLLSHLLPPVVFYPSGPKHFGAVVWLFIAVAVYPPPGGAVRDLFEDPQTPDDLYDWFSAALAKEQLSTRAERDAVDDVVRLLRRAVDARVFTPLHGLGVFGEPVKALPGTGGISAADSDRASPPSHHLLQSTEVVAVYSACENALLCDPSRAVSALPPQLRPGNVDCVRLIAEFEASSDSEQLEETLLLAEAEALSVWVDHQTAGASSRFSPSALEAQSSCLLVLPPRLRLQKFFTDVLPVAVGDTRTTFVVVLPPSLAVARTCLPSLCRALELADVVVASTDSDATLFDETSLAELTAAVATAGTPLVTPSGVPLVTPSGATAAERQPNFAVVCRFQYEKSLPFAPRKLFELGDRLAAETNTDSSVQVAWVCGSVWLSTRYAFRGDISLDDDSCLLVVQGDAWWAAVGEEDRPPDLDMSGWDLRHGDRQQHMCWVLLGPSDEACVDAWAKISKALDSALCDADEWRFWHRFDDPFPAWD